MERFQRFQEMFPKLVWCEVKVNNRWYVVKSLGYVVGQLIYI